MRYVKRIAMLLLAMVMAAPAMAAPTCPLVGAGKQRFDPGGGGAAAGVHVPAGTTDAPRPLVILLHGSGGTGAEMVRSSGLAAAADRHGFLLAYPDGGIGVKQGFVWNIPGVPTIDGTIPGPGARDDVAYLGRLVDGLVAAGCVDPARVYVTGLSGGGRMTSWLGCVAPGRFAAIAPVVGLRAGNPDEADPSRPDPRTCRPGRAVPVIAFAGDRDSVNPVEGGGAPYWRYPMHAAQQRWAAIDGCTAAPTTTWVAAKVYEERYAGCRDGSEVVARITVGGGHSWVVDNDALWQLLSRHRRDGAR